MNEIIANGTIGLLLILLQAETPLWIVTVLRVLIALTAALGVAWLLGFVLHEFKGWFWK